MALPMRTSEAGLELIKSFEGFRARATRLPGGKWIIGYGHTEGAREGLRVTREDAELVLRHHDLKPVEALINERVLTPLSQNEFDALVSFAFNIGADAFLESDVLSLLNSGERVQAAEGMTAWRKGRVDGEVRVIEALVRRRAAEKALFLEHPAGRIAVPGALLRPRFDPGAAMRVARDRAVVIEARGEDTAPAPQARPAASPDTAPQAAARAVAARISNLLGDQPAPPKPSKELQVEVPTAEEITLAVSALAEPDGPGEERLADTVIEARTEPPARRPQPLAPPPQPAVPEARRPVPPQVSRPAERGPAPPAGEHLTDAQKIMRWLPYALLSGLGIWGMIEGIRRTASPPPSRVLDGPDPAIVGPLLAFGSGMLCLVAMYYLYRAITRQD